MNDLIALRDLLSRMMALYNTDPSYQTALDANWPFSQSLDEMLYSINSAVCKE